MEQPAEKRFKAKLQKCLESHRKNPNLLDVAKLFLQTESDLAREFLLELTARLLKSMERARLRKPNPEEEAQMKFLGEDFTSLFNGPGHLLPIRGGTTRQLRSMTVSQLRQSAAAIRSHLTPRARMKAEYLEALADKMSPYARQHHRITVGDYLELAAAGIVPAARQTVN
jgi:hypothetical protein